MVKVDDVQVTPIGRASSGNALTRLLQLLHRRDYRFVTPTPASHAIVIARDMVGDARTLRDVLGWSREFRRDQIDGDVFTLLEGAGSLTALGQDVWRSAIRVSSLRGHLFIHSAYPTEAADAVFFGPDTYRFADAIVAELARRPLAPAATILDIGTGSGAGAIVAAAACADAAITMTDINPKALEYAKINAAFGGIAAQPVLGCDLSGVAGKMDLIMANPPYIVDPAGRAYRDGGQDHGSAVALTMTAMALARLAPGGRFLLYTGSAIVNGQDRLRAKLENLGADVQCTVDYREIDPDVFGEELANAAYFDVDRIAAVVAIFTAPGGDAAASEAT